MEELFVSCELSRTLQEKGFDKSCFGEYRQWDGSRVWLQLYQDLDSASTDDADYSYTTESIAPMYQQVVDWFREKHKLFIILNYTNTKYPNGNWECEVSRNNEREYRHFGFETNYEALEESIKQALKLI